MDPRRLHVVPEAVDEKRAAMASLSNISEAMGANFTPYAEKSLEYVHELLGVRNDILRHACVHFLRSMIGFYWTNYPNPNGVIYGTATTMHEETLKIVPSIMNELIDRLIDDEDIDVVALSIDSILLALHKFGPAVLPSEEGRSEKFYEALTQIAHEKQWSLVESEHKDLESSHSEMILDSLCDLFGGMARVQGQEFCQYFDHVIETVVGYCNSSRPDAFRSLAAGCIAEVLEFSSPAAARYVEALLPFTAQHLEDKSIHVRRNSAYLAGEIVHSLHMAGQAGAYAEGVQALVPLIIKLFTETAESKSESHGNMGGRDNAVAALCKFIQYSPTTVDKASLLPYIYAGLPLTSDLEESKNVYPMLIDMLSTDPELSMPYFQNLFKAVVETVLQPALHEETAARMAQFVRDTATTMPDEFAQMVVGLSDELKGIVNRVLHPEAAAHAEAAAAAAEAAGHV